MKRVDRIPDCVIPVLTVLLVAGVFKLFGGVGVLVLAIIATVIWIAQLVGPSPAMPDRVSSNAGEPQSPPSRPH
jgi:uncharacterized membrane protein